MAQDDLQGLSTCSRHHQLRDGSVGEFGGALKVLVIA